MMIAVRSKWFYQNSKYCAQFETKDKYIPVYHQIAKMQKKLRKTNSEILRILNLHFHRDCDSGTIADCLHL